MLTPSASSQPDRKLTSGLSSSETCEVEDKLGLSVVMVCGPKSTEGGGGMDSDAYVRGKEPVKI